MANFERVEFDGRRENNEILVAEAAGLHLIRRAEQVHIDLEAAAEKPGSGIAQVAVRFEHGLGDWFLVASEHGIDSRLRFPPEVRYFRFRVEARQKLTKLVHGARVRRHFHFALRPAEIGSAL